jgi:hypothetical protein
MGLDILGQWVLCGSTAVDNCGAYPAAGVSRAAQNCTIAYRSSPSFLVKSLGKVVRGL